MSRNANHCILFAGITGSLALLLGCRTVNRSSSGEPSGYQQVHIESSRGPVNFLLPRRHFKLDPKGTTYYVSSGGNDDADGTIERPWLTVYHALKRLEPGDVLYLRMGSYSTPFTVEKSGASDKPIVISSYPGEVARIYQPTGWQEKHPHDATITLLCAKYVWIQGLIVEGCKGDMGAPPCDTYGQNGISLVGGAGEGVRLLNNVISRAQHCGIKEMGHHGTHFLIEGNVIFDNGISSRDHGIYVPSSQAVVRGNAVFRNSGFGIHLYSKPRDCSVYDNLCFENGEAGIIVSGSGNIVSHNACARNATFGVLLFREECRNNVVRDNLLDSNRQGQFGADEGGRGKLGLPVDNDIQGNLLFPAKGWALVSRQLGVPADSSLIAEPPAAARTHNDYRTNLVSPRMPSVGLIGAIKDPPKYIGTFSADCFTDTFEWPAKEAH